MAAITVRRNVFLLPIKPLFSLQGLYHQFVELGDSKPRPLSEDDYLVFKPGEINVSKWKKFDSRSLGISRTLPPSPYAVLQILRTKGHNSLMHSICLTSFSLVVYAKLTLFLTGFEAYLVGGCVRDLLLKRTPKDFDVITTAHLDQVSSFDTLAKDTEGKEKFLISQMPKDCDKLDLLRWKNSMHRDFTINSLFFDPHAFTIYDYNDGMKDISELQLRTLVPAQLSFTEDSARILRALRIAARLGLSLSKEIKSAIFKQTSSVSRLGKFRTMMEINYMLSYGAAESSFSLLYKYHLLEILLPFQAAYISQQATRSDQSSMMLMKLLSHLDKLVACDRPSGSPLWIGVLAFHLALVKNPQHPFVILTFASVLYHQSWKDGLNFARRCGRPPVNFDPETLDSHEFISDDEVAKKVNQLAIQVVESVDVLMETHSLHNAMAKFPDYPSPCSGFVFIPEIMGHSAQQLFHVLAHKVEAYNEGRSSFEINFNLLKKGYSLETRFALGKIILNTMGYGVDLCEVNRHVASSSKNEKEKQGTNQPPLQFINLQQETASKKSTMQGKSQRVSSDPKNKVYLTYFYLVMKCRSVREIGKSDSLMVEAVINNEKLEIQNGEEVNRKVKVDESKVETISSLLWSVKTNFNMAIEEARGSNHEMRKLNNILVSFLEEQVERKKANMIGSLVSEVVEEDSSKELVKTSEHVKCDMKGEKKKQRVCSYCKEVGHNRTGCPKRKVNTFKQIYGIQQIYLVK
ncbi:hypothetical protein LXL04_013877 [Taraxacum kok-saghyz]